MKADKKEKDRDGLIWVLLFLLLLFALIWWWIKRSKKATPIVTAALPIEPVVSYSSSGSTYVPPVTGSFSSDFNDLEFN